MVSGNLGAYKPRNFRSRLANWLTGSHWGLKEMFQSISEVVERLTALLKEKSGASHGQKRRSTGQPRRDEAVRSGTEKRRAVEVLALSALRPSPEVLSVMQKNENDMPEKAARRGS